MGNSLDNKDAYAALRIKDYRYYFIARFLLTFGIQMQSVIVGWQVYNITKDPLSLGFIGLSEVIPFFCIALFAGHAADKFNRKRIILLTDMVYFLCALTLLLITTRFNILLHHLGALPVYCVIMATGLARGFIFPAMNALAAQLVPKELYGNSSTWNSMAWQVAAVSGPAVGGLIYGFIGIGAAYSVVVTFTIISFFSFLRVKNRPLPESSQQETIWQGLTAGIRFVFSNQILLSAISLDMFAVFFGGAVSMLPIVADQVLHVGAQGLGFLRAAPAIGSVIMSLALAYYPPFKQAGRNLLIGVAGFGLMIIAFALSRNFFIAMAVLIFSGAFDNISVVIRSTIIQLFTPDKMRGRVSAVNSIFIGSSNELGSFESGVAAKLLRLVPSIIFGGTMTLGVVGSVYAFAPKLRKLKL
jgi:MFS family permease